MLWDAPQIKQTGPYRVILIRKDKTYQLLGMHEYIDEKVYIHDEEKPKYFKLIKKGRNKHGILVAYYEEQND